MRSEIVVVIHEQSKPKVDTSPTAYPRVVEVVDSYLDRLRSLFDEVPVSLAYLNQALSGVGSPIAEFIEKKYGV